jgi:hypothetical protein
VRVVLKGIHKVKRRLANGEIKVHFTLGAAGPQSMQNPARLNSFTPTTKHTLAFGARLQAP